MILLAEIYKRKAKNYTKKQLIKLKRKKCHIEAMQHQFRAYMVINEKSYECYEQLRQLSSLTFSIIVINGFVGQ